MPLPKLLTSNAVVRFQDCDPYGHLYNAKFIDYFMNAREDQLVEHYDLDIYALGESDGVGWVVAQNQIAYLQPAMLMERVVITSRIINYARRTMQAELVMYSEDQAHVKALMWSNFVHFDLNARRPAQHDERFMQMFEEACYPVEEELFEDRVRTFRKHRHSMNT